MYAQKIYYNKLAKTFSTNNTPGSIAFPDWDSIWNSFSVLTLLKSKFSFRVLDYMDPRFRDYVEEIRDYHGGIEVVNEAAAYQRSEFNWTIETALRRDPYGNGIPKGIPSAISKITVDCKNQQLTWNTDDGMEGEISLTSRQTRRLTKDAEDTVWTKSDNKWN